jgi:heme-degrading monooxygenase HmoA
MIVVAIRHPVADYEAWKAVYDTRHPGTFGAKFARVNRGVDDPDTVTVVAGFDSVEEATAMTESPDLKAAMNQAGVTASPRIEMYEEVEANQY